MSHPSKVKGNRIELEIVDIFKQYGFTEAKRAWGSNGQSLGLHEEVDCYIPEIDLKIQSKGRKQIASYVIPNIPIVDIQVVKANNKPYLVITEIHNYAKDKQKIIELQKKVIMLEQENNKLKTDLAYAESTT